MKNILKVLVIAVLVFSLEKGYSQDFIYKSDGTQIECSVESVDSNNITYLSTKKSSKSQSLNVIQASLIVFQNGQYVTMPANKVKVDEARNARNLGHDVVITRYAEMIEGTIQTLSKSEIEILNLETNTVSKIKGDEAVFAAYSNGKHVLFRNAAEVRAILEYMHPQVIALSKKEVVPPVTPVTQPASGRPQHLATQSAPPSPVVINTAVNTTPNPVSKTTEKSSVTESGKSPEELSDIDFDEFSDKALQKIDDFTNYLSIISSKETYPESANQAIELAIELFVNEEVMVEVSTVGYAESVKRKIRDYLTRLKLLKYDKVEIQWADINYVSNFRKAPDGNYYGTLTVKQTFRGYKDNQVVYSDVTQKDVEVVIKGMEKSVEGQKEMVWDVLLSDIGVLDTK